MASQFPWVPAKSPEPSAQKPNCQAVAPTSATEVCSPNISWPTLPRNCTDDSATPSTKGTGFVSQAREQARVGPDTELCVMQERTPPLATEGSGGTRHRPSSNSVVRVEDGENQPIMVVCPTVACSPRRVWLPPRAGPSSSAPQQPGRMPLGTS